MRKGTPEGRRGGRTALWGATPYRRDWDQQERGSPNPMFNDKTIIQDSPFARFLFSDVRFASFWLVVRVYIGWLWLSSGWGKVQNPAWTDTGQALAGFWKGAVAIPAQGSPRITFDWYRNFLQFLIEIGRAHV